ncbi:hypothetical protein BU23DRAFT_313419 [Bimuria novae-zelandiae CBS 107.79]|uniref:Uncharacterized protein n=1 Tax=Bimuria novae-zelandiae CBS 107.79 TaxID=1447943 RepID=A0A6A5UPD7_9PLEO|nr:hypothetical protein BU23DRAFT_313419 [Bimuria novae-zelandiae CBS 107.79]
MPGCKCHRLFMDLTTGDSDGPTPSLSVLSHTTIRWPAYCRRISFLDLERVHSSIRDRSAARFGAHETASIFLAGAISKERPLHALAVLGDGKAPLQL